jgi:hypothetical protein
LPTSAIPDGTRHREQLGDTFDQLVALAIRWAGLRPLQIRSTDTSDEAGRVEWLGRKQMLLQAFVDGTLSGERPNVRTENANTRADLEELHERRLPGSRARSRRMRGPSRSRSRVTLYPDRPGLDSYVIKAAFGWLNVRAARTPEERASWLELIREFLTIVLEGIPVVTTAVAQEIDGLPTDFDDWVLQLVAGAIPALTPAERSVELWQGLIDRGSPAHQWVERFFWHWFTNGLHAANSPGEFVRIWRTMILRALKSPPWDPSNNVRHELDSIVFELLGLDSRWGDLGKSDTFAADVGSLVDVFAMAAQKWFGMPKVVNGFSAFAIRPGASKLLLPGIDWISSAVKTFDAYDWKYGLEDNVVEFLHVCWQRESQRISHEPRFREPFLAVLATLVSRGGHPAIALRDRVVGSPAG